MFLFVVILFTSVVSVAGQQKSIEPCAQISALTTANSDAVIPAQVALDCLKSIPIHKQNASAFVASTIPYIQWQSTVSSLKSPPPGYEQEPTDILGSLDNLVTNINADMYKSEYDYQVDLYNIITSAKDQHLRYIPDVLGSALGFKRKIALVSVSMDGVELPKVYTYADINRSLTDTTFKPSAIKTINGEDAPTFLENGSLLSFETGRDAGYNAMFRSAVMNSNPTKAESLGNFAGDQRYQFNYPGANTTFEYENGSTAVVETFVVQRMDFTGITDGESLYQKIVFPEFTKPDASAPSNTSVTTTNMSSPAGTPEKPLRMVGYPEPVVISSDIQVGGYYLNGTHNDTGVLTLMTYKPENPLEYQASVQSFLADMKRDGKTKIIIDLSTNTGGYTSLAFDTFRQFFPQKTENSYSRFRENPSFNQLVRLTNQIVPANFDIHSFGPTESDAALASIALSHFYYKYNVDVNRKPFASFNDEYAPIEINGDNYTNIAQYDFSNPLVSANATASIGVEVTGYGTRTNFTQPFPASNIVMLMDGQCGSSCSMFALNMMELGGVKTIAMGGRPNKNRMQGIGGTRGSLAYQWSDIHDKALEVLDFVAVPDRAKLTDLLSLTSLPLVRSLETELGARDQILTANLKDGVPAQLLNIPADCRLYYTPQTVTDVSKMWEAAADSAFGGKACNVGAITNDKPKRTEAVMFEPRDVLVRKAKEAKRNLEDARRKPVTIKARKGDGHPLPDFY